MRPSASVVKPILFVDLALLFAIVPLLPAYQSRFDLSKAQVGVVVAAYSAAVLVAAVPVGRVADRVGARRMSLIGIWLLAVSTLGFALAGGFWTLVIARAGQGLSSSISWSAGLSWLSSATPLHRRGAVFGSAMAYASAGGLLGPVFGGSLGQAYGVRATFVVLALVSAGLAVLAGLAPDAPAPRIGHVSLRETLGRALSRGPLLAAIVISATVAVVSGTLETLVPLRLGDDGYSAAVITVVLTLAGVLGVITNATVGRMYDRFGGVPIAVVAMAGTCVTLAALAAARNGLGVAAVYVVGSPFITGQYAVQFPLAADGADRVEVGESSAFGVINLAWGLGFMVGPAAGAALASATSDAAAYLLLLVLSGAVASRIRILGTLTA